MTSDLLSSRTQQYTACMISIFSAGPIAPKAELFYDGMCNLIDISEGDVSLDLSPVFPFEDRNDGFDYDTKVFSGLAALSKRIRPVFTLAADFCVPGRSNWSSGLDEAAGDGMPFLAMRLADVLDDMHSVIGEQFAGVDILLSAKKSDAKSLASLVAEHSGYSSSNIRLLNDAQRRPSAWKFLPTALWEEQLAAAMQGKTDSPLFEQVRAFGARVNEVQRAWSVYLEKSAALKFEEKREEINFLRQNRQRGLWPFSSCSPAAAHGCADSSDSASLGSAGRRVAFEEFGAVLRAILEERSDETWFREFLLTLGRSEGFSHC